jgi:multisubunit Na+/H+ antiporter MnhC subunit
MSEAKEAMVAYLATLGAIVLLTIAAVVICMTFDGKEDQLAKVIAALAFIGGSTTGLIGVIGTFRPKGPPLASTDSGDVNVGGKAA